MREVIEAWETRADTTSWYAKRIREEMISQTNVALKRNVGLIKALIAICPVAGSAGYRHRYGLGVRCDDLQRQRQCPRHGRGCIPATVPTMAGMVAALSGVYFGTWLEHKAVTRTEALEDQLQHHA